MEWPISLDEAQEVTYTLQEGWVCTQYCTAHWQHNMPVRISPTCIARVSSEAIGTVACSRVAATSILTLGGACRRGEDSLETTNIQTIYRLSKYTRYVFGIWNVQCRDYYTMWLRVHSFFTIHTLNDSLHNSSAQFRPVYPGGHTQLRPSVIQVPPFAQQTMIESEGEQLDINRWTYTALRHLQSADIVQ